jgi:DNA repair exonuclease SbcCD ATPase subunit
MHRESMIYRQIGHFLMPSSGNLVTKNKQLSRAVDLLSQASEEIDRLTAGLAEADDLRKEAREAAMVPDDRGLIPWIGTLRHRMITAEENLMLLEDELAAVKEESAETCRKLLEYNHRIEAELAEARVDSRRLDLLQKWGNVSFSWPVGDLRKSIDRAELNLAAIDGKGE